MVMKDFRVRYRNMSLGVFWSLLNPLVMMSLYTFIFSRIFHNPIPHFHIHLLCGIITFNFFTLAWISATNSIVENYALVKRTPIRREVVPMAAILSNMAHLFIQFGLLVVFVYASGLSVNGQWVWLPVVWGMQLAFLLGLGLASAALNVVFRDMRYVVESVNVMMFWGVPIIYSFDMVPAALRDIYQYNPVAALVLATHNVVIDGQAPSWVLMTKLAAVSTVALAGGWVIFRRLERRFYEYL